MSAEGREGAVCRGKPHGLQRTGSRQTGDGKGNDEQELHLPLQGTWSLKLAAGDKPLSCSDRLCQAPWEPGIPSGPWSLSCRL